MTTWDRTQLRPQLPVYTDGRNCMVPSVPSDMWPSGLGPGYSVYASAHGRYLAGHEQKVNEMDFDKTSEGIETYPNELDILAAADDVSGNGLFDPPGTQGNIHPSYGVFADHQSLPGYVARDQFYTQSEVANLTQPDGGVAYVPGGAVSFQQGQTKTFEENKLLWELPQGINPLPLERLPHEGIVDAPTATQPVSGLGSLRRRRHGVGEETKQEMSMKPYYVAGGVGIAIGLAWVFLGRGKKGRKR